MTIPPTIIIGRSDYVVLAHLASAGSGSADELQTELDRAAIIDDVEVPPNVVRMGSTVGYTVDGNKPTTVTLVYPIEADIEKGRVSIMTPIGTALIGLAPGQAIDWKTRDGNIRTLKVVTVFSGGPTDTLGERLEQQNHFEPSDDPGPTAA